MNKRVITPKRTLLTEKFLLVPFGTFFVSEQKRHFQDRALAIIPLTKQDMADASSSVSIESCESLHELICRCRCGKTFLIELYEEVAALQCFFGTPSRRGTSRPQGNMLFQSLLCFVWRPPRGKRGHLRKAGSRDRNWTKQDTAEASSSIYFKLILRTPWVLSDAYAGVEALMNFLGETQCSKRLRGLAGPLTFYVSIIRYSILEMF